MYEGCKKYIPFTPIKMEHREWPDKVIDHAPIWCSVDLRDGNQALVNPMNLEEKLEMFQLLVDIGVKEIEVGFPSASETEYEILRTLIEKNCIPDDVTIQVLVQAREHLIRKTFEAIEGAKNVIVHFYNSTSTLQRKVVFKKDMDGIIEIAANGAKLIKELTDEMLKKHPEVNIRYEYSPESFTGTEMDNAVAICERVMELLDATPENKVILNLPSTVEGSTPNGYADQIEYFCKHLKNRESAIISLHPHNDRGTGVAGAELSLMAGADRIEGTLFGNGERTGNVDIVTLALNMYTQGVDPQLDFSNINHVREVYERTIDPADVGREYEPIIRINSQSGKGGAAFIMSNNFGYELPKAMHPEFGKAVKAACDAAGTEITPQQVFDLFKQEYIDVDGPYQILKMKYYDEGAEDGSSSHGRFVGIIKNNGFEPTEISGEGNGPIDAFFNALQQVGISGYHFEDYSEHAISIGSDAKAVSYIHLTDAEGKNIFGVGISHNIYYASIRGVLCAINRSMRAQKAE